MVDVDLAIVAQMADDWRVTVSFDDSATVGWLAERLRVHRVEDDARERLGGRVSVSGEGTHVFLYSNTAAAAQEAEKVVRAIVAERGLRAGFALDRWHSIEERWEDGSQPVPETASERATERQRLEAEEAARSQASGLAEWEVRVEMPSHHAAVAFADRMQSAGRMPVRRWKYLVIGANNEAEARALAKTIRDEAPDGSVTVEPAFGMVQEVSPTSPFAPFAIFG